MGRYFRLILLFLRVSVQDDAAYRADFLLHSVIAFLQLGAELFGLWIIFSNTESLNGWDAWQMLALMGVFRVMSGVIGLGIAPNMRAMMEDVRSGTLDFVLLKPVNPQFYVSARRFVLWRGMDIVVGLVMAGTASVKLGTSVGVMQAALFLLMLGAGVVIIYSFWLALATLAFWLTRISNIEMVFWNVFEAGRYPVDIYRPWLRWLLTFFVPLAFLTTFPAGMLVGKGTPSGMLMGWLAAAVALTGATLFWRFGLRRYSGASA
ncbi:MAG: ABC-2 family transporter protein [Phycisphaerales bacterium]|nr:ABC-2 family transporter protein [Phycisphaerales bacterium]